MGQTVNLVAQPSQVRILLPPLCWKTNTGKLEKSRCCLVRAIKKAALHTIQANQRPEKHSIEQVKRPRV